MHSTMGHALIMGIVHWLGPGHRCKPTSFARLAMNSHRPHNLLLLPRVMEMPESQGVAGKSR